jgi:hypothetical protein
VWLEFEWGEDDGDGIWVVGVVSMTVPTTVHVG